jgi:uracil-DNA glycosylase family 4
MRKLGAVTGHGQRGATLDSTIDPVQARALLRWLVDAGADEALCDAPVDRFAVAAEAPVAAAPTPAPRSSDPRYAPPSQVAPAKPVELPRVATISPALMPASTATKSAREIAAAAKTLDDLRAAVEAFDGCQLKVTAKHTVFADGHHDAPVMLIGEAPGRDEDLQGLPFVGRSGHLLDRMLNAIGLDRSTSAYITNVIFWRPPGNRPPTPEEAAVCAPFLLRHIELKKPKVLVLLGGTPVKHVLGIEEGITRTRGKWGRYMQSGMDIPALPTFHPAYLLRQPAAKKLAWQDLMSLKLRLRELGVG